MLHVITLRGEMTGGPQSSKMAEYAGVTCNDRKLGAMEQGMETKTSSFSMIGCDLIVGW